MEQYIVMIIFLSSYLIFGIFLINVLSNNKQEQCDLETLQEPFTNNEKEKNEEDEKSKKET
jgi:hypothetical protein